jgi:Lipase (class 3)
MNLMPKTSPFDGAIHRVNLALLNAALTAFNIGDMINAVPGIFSGLETFGYSSSGGYNTRTVWIYDSNTNAILILCTGMQNYQQVPYCLQGWSENWDYTTQTLYPFETSGLSLAVTIGPLQTGLYYSQVRIIGHSYGGAVAPYLAKQMFGLGVNTDLDLWTYGAPKPGVSRNAVPRRVAVNVVRCFQQYDPVPTLPPSSRELGQLWRLVGVPTARRWSEWFQSLTGVTITSPITMAAADYPAVQQTYQWVLTVAAWASGLQAFGNPMHSLDSYAAAFTLMPQISQTILVPATYQRGRNEPDQTVPQMVADRDIVIEQASDVIEADTTTAVLSILGATTIVRGERYRGGSSYGFPVVRYAGNIVAYCKTRRLRRALVRSLNKVLS